MMEYSVYVNAWKLNDHGDIGHCDADKETPDGWSAWVQISNSKTLEIDVAEEYDFNTRDAAIEKAEILTVKYDTAWEEF